MHTDESQPTRLERLAASAVAALNHAGLSKFAHSAMMRRLGKRFLLRADAGTRDRAIISGLGKGLKLRVLPETPKSYRDGDARTGYAGGDCRPSQTRHDGL